MCRHRQCVTKRMKKLFLVVSILLVGSTLVIVSMKRVEAVPISISTVFVDIPENLGDTVDNGGGIQKLYNKIVHL